MKKVLIITYYWPPAGGSGVQRWLKFAKYFRDFGIEPIIYTVENPNYPIEDDSLINDIPENIKVIKQPIWEPNTLFSNFKSKKRSAGFLNPNPSFFGKILQYIRANYFIPDARKFWINPSFKYLKKLIDDKIADVIITTGPPHSLHLIANKLKKETDIKWIADFRDPWTEIDYFHHLPLTQKSKHKHKQLEYEVLKNANVITVVGKSMKENYERVNKNTVVVTNGYDSEELSKEVKLDKEFTITHIGMMNADRNHQVLWEVLTEVSNEVKGFRNDFKLNLIGATDSSVINDVKKYNLESNVKIEYYIPHNEVLKLQKKSQLLLLLVNNVPSSKGIITGKIFEYLIAKRPILAIAPENGDLSEILSKTNSGVVVDLKNKSKLKKHILAYYNSFKNNALSVNSTNIEQYHRRELTKKFSEIIKSL